MQTFGGRGSKYQKSERHEQCKGDETCVVVSDKQRESVGEVDT